MNLSNFTPLSAFAGGALIGLAAAVLLYFNGRILGASGILSQALFFWKEKTLWPIVFLAGLLAGAGIYRWGAGGGLTPTLETSTPVLVLAGLLVGLGTNLGSGCTSGHGICGMARLSKRSIAATLIFMACGVVTASFLKSIVERLFQ